MSVAQALDAADGVMDGKFHGVPIVETSAADVVPIRHASRAAYTSSTARALDAADGVIDGAYYGRPIVETSSPAPRYVRSSVPYRSSTALSLDAADGVIDGKYFGTPIVEGGSARRVVSRGIPTTVRGGYTTRSSAAVALDAADGVIDGKYYGRDIVESSPRVIRGGYPVTRSSAAYALDAADGVIDGKYYGSDIVTSGRSYLSDGYTSGRRVISGASRIAPTRVIGDSRYDTGVYGARVIEQAPLTSRVIDGGYHGYHAEGHYDHYDHGVYGASVIESAPSRVVDAGYSRYGRSLAYDSGYHTSRVIDGYSTSRGLDRTAGLYGSRLVDAPGYRSVYPTTYSGRSYAGDSYIGGGRRVVRGSAGLRSGAAQALDAADGVIDGKFHGRDIIEA